MCFLCPINGVHINGGKANSPGCTSAAPQMDGCNVKAPPFSPLPLAAGWLQAAGYSKASKCDLNVFEILSFEEDPVSNISRIYN